MKRHQLEHLIRAAADIADDDEIVVIGSQAILGQFPDAPEVLVVSNEADVYPRNFPERADLIDGTIGELSPFHDTYGYYAQGVGERTAVLPLGWEARLVMVKNPNTRGAAGLCLEVHDLAISKLVPWREKDQRFLRGLVDHRMVTREVLDQRLATTSVEPAVREAVEARIARLFARSD
ncbi:MAG: hypothetical protein KF901_27300 [Myxococcales bacterium]|nr:hypothetical protein [Myxococcales bacterium]